MATSYGYVERNLENDVNWGAVGKGFSDMLIAERDEREAKKASLDEMMTKTQDELSKNVPLGYNTDFNDRMTSFIPNANAYVLSINKDLKSGAITPAEYMSKMQKLNSSTDTMFGLANNFNSWYEDRLKRMDSGESGAVEQLTVEAMSKLVDFNQHDFFIDNSGTVVAAPLKKGADGITSLDTSNAKSVQAIFNLAQNTVNKFDVNKEVNESIKLLGKNVLTRDIAATYAKEGKMFTLEGLKLTDKVLYEKYVNSQIDKFMASDLNIASILDDNAALYKVVKPGEPYDPTKNIQLDFSNGREVGVTEITEQQRKDARAYLRTQFDSQAISVDVEKAEPVLKSPTPPSMTASERRAYGRGQDPNYVDWATYVRNNRNKGKGWSVTDFNNKFGGYGLKLKELPVKKDASGKKYTPFNLYLNGNEVLTEERYTDNIEKYLLGTTSLRDRHQEIYDNSGASVAARNAAAGSAKDSGGKAR
jgi:hypothetical protein